MTLGEDLSSAVGRFKVYKRGASIDARWECGTGCVGWLKMISLNYIKLIV